MASEHSRDYHVMLRGVPFTLYSSVTPGIVHLFALHVLSTKALLCFLAAGSTENIQITINFRGKLWARILSIRIHPGPDCVGSSDFFFFLTTVTAKVEFHFYALRKTLRFYSY